MILASVRSPWRYDCRLSIRQCFAAGQLSAAMGGDRTDCPHPGNTKPTRICRPRPAGSATIRSDKRAAWLAGFDGQKDAMK